MSKPLVTDLFDIAGPRGLGPSTADLKMLLTFHRAVEDYMVFMQKHPEKGFGLMDTETEHRGAVLVGDLPNWFPEMVDELLYDAYFTINGFRQPRRRKRDVSHLNAIFADLDHYGIGYEEAVAKIVQAIRLKHIPCPSLLSFSGRGTWLFWILNAANPADPGRIGGAPIAYPEVRTLWERVMIAAHNRIKDIAPELQPDAKAVDMSRVTRVPSSVNTKTGKDVQYFIPAKGSLEGFTYTLADLAEWFGVDTAKPQRAQRTSTGKKIEGNARGHLALHEHRLQDFTKLWEYRRGFTEGCRNHAALIYAWLLRKTNHGRDEAFGQVMKLASQCSPPLSKKEAIRQFNSGWAAMFKNAERKGKPSAIPNRTLANWLVVTPEEVHKLGLKHLSPDYTPTPPKKSQRKPLRRLALVTLVAECEQEDKPLPTVRQLAEQLTKMGNKCNKDTVAKDLRELGIAHSRKRATEDETPTTLTLFDPDVN